jgi:hypothetical protein
MKLDKVQPLIKGKGDYDIKATMEFAEKILEDETSTNVERTLAHNLKRSLKHLDFWLGKYMSTSKETKEYGKENWIPASVRFPNPVEIAKDNGNFMVQIASGERFLCEFDSLSNGYDTPNWNCNEQVVAWMPLPGRYIEDIKSNT